MVEKLRTLLLIAVLTSGLLIKNSECRVVNLQNAWTLPQEDFSVFYRYFRDKISWYEADAVCQFHHADLVTIDNVIKFDAVRAFLKELDVTVSVWIGLRRQDNLHRFLWTNLKELDQFNSYWANELPLTEEPLCAYIDPISGYRWQAVRCGGPESSGFLCELPVPQWATKCTELSMLPSLTMQYIADNGVVQLSRDCGELGTRNVTCSGKEDPETMLQQLQCTSHENITLTDMADNKNLAAKIISKSIEDILSNKLTEETEGAVSIKALDSLEMVKTSLDSHEVVYSADKDQILDVTQLNDRSIDNFSNKLLMDEKRAEEFEEMRRNRAKSLFDLNDLMQGDQYVEPATHVVEVEKLATTNVEEVFVNETTAESSTEAETTAITTAEPDTTTVASNKTLAKHILHNPQIYLRDLNNQPTTKSYDDQEGGKEAGSNDHFVPPMMLVKAKYTKPPTLTTAEEETTVGLSTTAADGETVMSTDAASAGTTAGHESTTSETTSTTEIVTATSTEAVLTTGNPQEPNPIVKRDTRRFLYFDNPQTFWPRRHQTSFVE